jgi:hypothetical protein
MEDRNLLSPPYGDWGAPVNLGPTVNTEYADQHPAISKDGLSLYITTNRPENPDDLVRDDNIWVSHRATPADPWRAPVELGPAVNSAANDRVPAFSRDGHWMFFGSNRAGGFGALDVWASYREDVHDDFDWQPAVNLGPGVNSIYNEDGPTFFQDDATGAVTLYFTSQNRPNNVGDWDIYASTQSPDGSFGAGVLVPELSSPARDTRTAIRHDGREMFITSNRIGGQGGLDLWVSTRESTADPWGMPVNLGGGVNSAADDGAPALSANGTELYFYSNRTGSIPDALGLPTNDLYVTTRTKLYEGPGAAGEMRIVGSAGATGVGLSLSALTFAGIGSDRTAASPTDVGGPAPAAIPPDVGALTTHERTAASGTDLDGLGPWSDRSDPLADGDALAV